MLHKLVNFLSPSISIKPDINALPNGIYCLNYHRVGNKEDTNFDKNVFSCSTNNFRKQIEYFKDNFTLITPLMVDMMISKGDEITSRFLLITFDDGYIDNYTNAYPILKSLNVPATFFVATDYISSGKIPWWDAVAYMINKTNLSTVKYKELSNKSFKLNNKQKVTRDILRVIKSDVEFSITEKLSMLSSLLEVKIPSTDKEGSSPLFMTWEMLAEMSINNMEIGSHTCSHQLLSHLDVDEQKKELASSKRTIEERTGQIVIALAYPIGAVTSYSYESCNSAHQCGYRLAFDFEKGINKFPLNDNRFELHRFPVNYDYDINSIIDMFIKFS